MTIREKLGKEWLFIDGAMGTMLEKAGLPAGMLSETWNRTNPEKIEAIHRAYLAAGCNVILANTFGANQLKHGEDVGDVIRAGLDCARRAVAVNNAPAYVALDIGPTGKLLKPFGDLAFEDAYDIFSEMVIAGRDADLIVIETLSDTYEAKAAVLAAKEHADVPIIVTLSFDANGKLLTGGSVAAAAVMLEGLGVDALGFNCGLGPDEMIRLMPELTRVTNLPIVVCPNAGLPVAVNGRTTYNVAPSQFAKSCLRLAELGASALGGCCGTTPDHIAALVQAVSLQKINRIFAPDRTEISSYTKSVCLDDGPVLIGERINPTGKPKLKQALTTENYEYLAREAIAQAEAGAHLLDVNVGLPGIDEAEAMLRAVTLIQSVTQLPLVIDTAHPDAMASALRLYNGKPLVNSVNGKRESIETVLPLVKQYGAAVIALTLDESGIPETADGRLAIARRIIDAAEKLGIDRKNILVDALTLPVSAGRDHAKVTLETLHRARTELGAHTVLGVSNVSFGLPNRGGLNAAFFITALSQGLSAGIINPLQSDMVDAYAYALALLGYDEACGQYIARFSQSAPAPVVQTQEMTLRDAVQKGLCSQAGRIATELTKTRDAMDIIDNELIPALDTVGRGFERQTVFLPQLLMSSDAARAAFDAIRSAFPTASKQSRLGPIILATVHGDIHDIGKNIVRALMENYGYFVIDLGKDVAPEHIVDAAIKHNAPFVGLSALMTTTVPAMEETIIQLRKSHPCRIIVGGAVLTQSYADQIGADHYAPDAMSAVRYIGEAGETVKGAALDNPA